MIGPVSVIKIGGALLEDEAAFGSLRQSLREASQQGRVVLIHGGGPQSTALANRLGHDPLLINGRRVTTDEDLRIALWTMRGELNARLVAALNADGLRACGISGVDGYTISATRRPPWTIEGREVDFGHVGDVRSVDTMIIQLLLDQSIIPVVAPLATDDTGNIFNVNADTVATDIAIALGADRLVYVADSGGLWRDASDRKSLIASMSQAEYEVGVKEGWISHGMRVKLENAFRALDSGVLQVFVAGADSLSRPASGTQIVSANMVGGRT